MIVGDFEITGVDVYAQYGGQRVTSVPPGASFEIHVDYMIKNSRAGLTGWSTAMTVYSNSQLENVGVDMFGDHYGSGLNDAHDAINAVKPDGTTYYLVQIFASQLLGAGTPPDYMWYSSTFTHPDWTRLWWGILVVESGAGARYSGEITSVTPLKFKAGSPVQLNIAFLAHTSSAWDALNGWHVRAIVTLDGVVKTVDSALQLGANGSGTLTVNWGTMKPEPMDGIIVLRAYGFTSGSYYEDVDSTSVQILVTEEPPPPPPPPPPPDQATLYGQVKDSSTQVVLVSVKVTADGKTAYTNTSGNYTLTGLTPGVTPVSFSKSGYQTRTQSFTLLEGNNLLNVQMVKGTAPPPGQTCSIDADCPEGYVCKAGVCVKKSAIPDWLLPALAIGAGVLLLVSGKKSPEKAAAKKR